MSLVFTCEPSEVMVHMIDGQTGNPRGRAGDVSALKADIAEHGQLQAAVVHLANGSRYMLGGHRRQVACQELGIKLRCVMWSGRPLETPADIVGAMISLQTQEDIAEVVQRDGVVVAGTALSAFRLKAGGASVEEISTALGVGGNKARAFIAVVSSAPEVIRAAALGELGMTVLYPNLTQLTLEQQTAVMKYVNKTGGKYSRTAIADAIRELQENDWKVPEPGQIVDVDAQVASLTSAESDSVRDVPADAHDYLTDALGSIRKAAVAGTSARHAFIIAQAIDALNGLGCA